MQSRNAIFGGVLFAALTLGAIDVHADNDALARAQSLYEELRYEEAYAAYREALAIKGNRPADIADIYLHLGILAASMDRKDEAVDQFARLLLVNPGAQLAKGVPPKVRGPFETALLKRASTTPFRLDHAPLNRLPAAGGLQVEAQLQGDSLDLARGITLRYRQVGATSYSALSKEGKGRLLFTVAASELPAKRDVEYFLELNDAFGGVLLEFGAANSPIVVRAAQGGPTPVAAAAAEPAAAWYKNPWIWVATGAGAVLLLAGGTAVAVALATAPTPTAAEFGKIETEVAHIR
jgi:tetratricopeptide (TPR) repeat protein